MYRVECSIITTLRHVWRKEFQRRLQMEKKLRKNHQLSQRTLEMASLTVLLCSAVSWLLTEFPPLWLGEVATAACEFASEFWQESTPLPLLSLPPLYILSTDLYVRVPVWHPWHLYSWNMNSNLSWEFSSFLAGLEHSPLDMLLLQRVWLRLPKSGGTVETGQTLLKSDSQYCKTI